MKNVFITAVFVLFVQSQLIAQKFEQLDNNPTDITYLLQGKMASPLVKVVYGRPHKKEDKVFGQQVPFGKIWRTGANEATEVKFYNDIIFGDKIVKAGTYIMHTIPGEKEWIIILNSTTDTWGSNFYNKEKDVARIMVPCREAEELDDFSIAFKKDIKNTYMVLAWDTTRIDVPLQTNSEILAKI